MVVVVCSIRSVAHCNTVSMISGTIEVETNVGVSVSRQMVVPELRYVVDLCGPPVSDLGPIERPAVA